MKKIKIYIDTSVIGGLFDEDFENYPILEIRSPMEVLNDN